MHFSMGGGRPFFSAQEIEAARSYKYSGTDDSILCKLFLRRFWNWAINFVPMSIAPNLITLIGFAFEVSSFILSFIISDGLQKTLPGWVCVWNGISLFIYQTLDNLDGRQARRTSSSSALGQFFDHGCDALTGVFELIKCAASADLKASKVTFWFVFLMGIGFFLTSFEEYVTGALYMGVINGPDEGLFILMTGHVLIGILPAFRVLFVNIPMYIIFIVAVGATIGASLISMVKKSAGDRAKQKNALIGIIGPLISITLTIVNVLHSDANIESVFFIMYAGFVLQYQAQQTILGHLVLKEPLRLLLEPTVIILWVLLLPPLLLENTQAIAIYWIIAFVVVMLVIVNFDVNVVFGLSRGLEIPVLTLKRADALDTVEIEEEDEAAHREEEAGKDPEMQTFNQDE